MSFPFTNILPNLGDNKLDKRFINVDFPEPDFP